MRIKIALILVAALALTVPGAALAHKGGGGAVKHKLRDHAKKHIRHAIDHRLDRAWRHHVHRGRHRTWELDGTETIFTGHGKLGSRTIEQGADAVSKFRAWRGVLKVWALSPDVKVECKGRGYKRTHTKKDGTLVTKCKGIGHATVTGSNYMVYFRARLGQAKFPEGSKGTIHTWGRAGSRARRWTTTRTT